MYSLADPNWNVIALADETGTIAERITYDSFGRVTFRDASFGVKPVSTFNWTRLFTGQVYDFETGIMLYRNRFYHSGLGRFVTRDPIGYKAGDVSLYRYVFNLPLLLIDPSGNQLPGQVQAICDIIPTSCTEDGYVDFECTYPEHPVKSKFYYIPNGSSSRHHRPKNHPPTIWCNEGKKKQEQEYRYEYRPVERKQWTLIGL